MVILLFILLLVFGCSIYRDVFPGYAANDFVDRHKMNIELRRDFMPAHSTLSQGPDSDHLFCGQFGLPTSFASSKAIFRDGVFGIIFAGTKEEMLRINTGRIITAMANKCSRGQIPYED